MIVDTKYCGMVFGVFFALLGTVAAETHVVVGTKGHRWRYEKTGAQSTEEGDKASPGKPAGRSLVIKVKNGDNVSFKVETGGFHSVILENARKELKEGIWKVVDGELAGDEKRLKKFGPDAQKTKHAEKGDLIQIEILNLKKGVENGILFGCDPHSVFVKDGKLRMLGVIVLAE